MSEQGADAESRGNEVVVRWHDKGTYCAPEQTERGGGYRAQLSSLEAPGSTGHTHSDARKAFDITKGCTPQAREWINGVTNNIRLLIARILHAVPYNSTTA